MPPLFSAISRTFSLGIIIFLIAGCSTAPISRKQFRTLDEKELRSLVLTETPVGSSQAFVEKFISDVMKRDYKINRTDSVGYMNRSGGFSVVVNEGDFKIQGYLATYNQRFWTCDVVLGVWLFDSSGHLRDLVIRKWTDGP